MTQIDWKSIPNFVGLYWVNPQGRVKNCKHELSVVNGKVVLYKDGQTYTFKVSKIVDSVFGGYYEIPNS